MIITKCPTKTKLEPYVAVHFVAWGAMLALPACSDSDEAAQTGEGQVAVTVYGESFIEEGIPADEMADGWSVQFDRFVVTIGGSNVAGTDIAGVDELNIRPPTDGAGHTIAEVTVPAGAHTGSSFSITKVVFAGAATKDGVTKTFDWAFDGTVEYTDCEASTEVSNGGSATFQITVHADHFFFDSLVSDSPEVRFQALADADTDGDGAITQAELAAADIGSYDPGSEGGINDLWSWLEAQYQQLGHVDGEGHCTPAVVAN